MLKNVERITLENLHLGYTGDILFDSIGEEINAFRIFSENLINKSYPYSTRTRYQQAVARFIDYLCQYGVMENLSSNAQINRAVDSYPVFLARGINHQEVENPLQKKLRKFAEEIGIGVGLSKSSITVSLAAVNKFLIIAQTLADEANIIAKQNNSKIPPEDVLLTINSIDGVRDISHYEKKRLKQNSLLGSVMRLRGTLQRPRKLTAPRMYRQIDLESLDFPQNRIKDLIDAATCNRDKCLYSLLRWSSFSG